MDNAGTGQLEIRIRLSPSSFSLSATFRCVSSSEASIYVVYRLWNSSIRMINRLRDGVVWPLQGGPLLEWAMSCSGYLGYLPQSTAIPKCAVSAISCTEHVSLVGHDKLVCHHVVCCGRRSAQGNSGSKLSRKAASNRVNGGWWCTIVATSSAALPYVKDTDPLFERIGREALREWNFGLFVI